MRPFLIVGCGGSGGATLQYLMDQLKADLSAKGVDALPAAWQFVHVDVPLQSDGDDNGMPPTVGASAGNGRYIGLTSAGARLSTLTEAAASALAARKQLHQLGSWATDPREHDVPVVTGAGQKRSVGRVVTLNRAGKILTGLQEAFAAMTAAGAKGQLATVAERLSPGTEVQGQPVVMVVSSMAGGAGASMVLDVCRLLTQVPSVQPSHTSLFLYTPEVFDRLAVHARRDMPGNALAMTGELLATQLGAATADDLEVLRALGLPVDDTGSGASFGRVIPIGARIGADGATFANGDLQDIYRGVGRGLAALMLSGQAMSDWIKYDLTNDGAREDDRKHLGWGATGATTQWGSFGFAQLSLGRDRYAEYAAQRIARAAVVRLVAGHRHAGGKGTEQEQLERLAGERYPYSVDDLDLPGPEGVSAWFKRSLGQLPTDRAHLIVGRVLEPLLPTGATPADQWTALVVGQLRNSRANLHADADQAAYDWVHAWWTAFIDRVLRVVGDVVALEGLPVARELLDRLRKDVDGWAQQLRDGARLTPQDVLAVSPQVLAQVQQLRGSIDARHAGVDQLRRGYADAVASTIAGLAAGKLGDVLSTLGPELLVPLRDAAVDAVATLQPALAADVRGGGLAHLRTDDVAEWPAEDRAVPPRFSHAQNEVLLIDATTFGEQFETHLVETASTQDGAPSTAARSLGTAVQQVVLNEWPTPGVPPTGGLVQRVVDWRPTALPLDPGRQDRVPSRRGQYRFTVQPAELLTRARAWVQRLGEPFERFTNTSLYDYVAGEDVTPAERLVRTEEVTRRFLATLELAQPLVHVNKTMVATVHRGDEARPIYKFSEVPFGDALGQALVHQLSRQDVDGRSVDALRNALRPTSTASRIDVFGSFAPLSPLAISSLLVPLDKGWSAALTAGAQADFYFHRRSRRLAGALAMSDRQRRAVIGGWYVARNTGRLRLPGEAHALETVQIYDPVGQEWVAFPSPLVVPRALLAGREHANNMLPAVLLSFGVALARASASASFLPLRPYTLLRQYWDDSPLGLDRDSPGQLTAASHLRDWVAVGAAPPGAPERYATRQGATAEATREALLERFTTVRDWVGGTFLPASEHGAKGGGPWSSLTRTDEVFGMPLFHEAAQDVFAVTSILVDLLADPRIGLRDFVDVN